MQCQGCGVRRKDVEMCPSCYAALETGRIFNVLTQSYGVIIEILDGGKVVLKFPNGEGGSGDTLKDAFELMGFKLKDV